MSFIAGLVWGLVIAGLTVAAEHYGPSYRTLSLSGNGALAVISVLVPLAVYRGWTWVTNRWSGRAVVPAIAYVAGLWLGVGFVAPIDVLLYPQGPGSTLVNAIPGLLLSGAVFVLPVALVARQGSSSSCSTSSVSRSGWSRSSARSSAGGSSRARRRDRCGGEAADTRPPRSS